MVNVLVSTAFGGKRLILVKESGNSPEFKSLSLRHETLTPNGVGVFVLCGIIKSMHRWLKNGKNGI